MYPQDIWSYMCNRAPRRIEILSELIKVTTCLCQCSEFSGSHQPLRRGWGETFISKPITKYASTLDLNISKYKERKPVHRCSVGLVLNLCRKAERKFSLE